MEKGIVFDIRHFSVHDGPGIRTTVFLKGCPLRCAWCHNPESQNPLPEISTRINRLDGKEYRQTEIIGKQMTVSEVFHEIETHITFFDESGGGVTFSGGEPLMQPTFLEALLKKCMANGIPTAVDTCGYGSANVFEKILPYSNLLLFDIKLINPSQHHKYTGADNQQILKNLFWLDSMKASIIVRIPLIPQITDSTDNLLAIKGIVEQCQNVRHVDLLPYHHMAKDKYRRLNIPYSLSNLKPYKPERLKEIANLFSGIDKQVSIGG